MASELVVRPTSVSVNGGATATINTDGSVDFTDVNTMVINGVFSSAHKDYKVVLTTDGLNVVTSTAPYIRMTSSGAINTNNSYLYAYTTANNTSTSIGDGMATYWAMLIGSYTTNGHIMYFLSPYLEEPTCQIMHAAGSNSVTAGGYMRDWHGIETSSTSWDGFSFQITTSSYSTSGRISVYGLAH